MDRGRQERALVQEAAVPDEEGWTGRRRPVVAGMGWRRHIRDEVNRETRIGTSVREIEARGAVGGLPPVEIKPVEEGAAPLLDVATMTIDGRRAMGASAVVMLLGQQRLRRHQAGLQRHVQPDGHEQRHDAGRPTAAGASEPGDQALTMALSQSHRP